MRRYVSATNAAAVVFCVCSAFAAGPDLGEDQFAVAAAHYSKGRWDLAEQELTALLRIYPEHRRSRAARFYLGEVLSQQRRHAEAREHYLAYLTQASDGPHSRHAQYRAAEAAFLAGDQATAVAEFASFCDDGGAPDASGRDSLLARAAAYLGKAALAEGDYAAAQARFEQSLAAESQGALADDVRLGLSQALQAAGEAAEAARTLQALSSATANSRSDEARYRLGVLHYNEGRFAEAIDSFAAFDTSFQDSPLRAKAMLSRGWALYRLQRFLEAAESFHVAAADPALQARALYWQGLSLIAHEDWPGAVAVLSKLERLDDESIKRPEVLFQLAFAEEKAGAIEAASAHFALLADAETFSTRRDQAGVALARIAAKQNQPLAARDRAADLTKRNAEPAAGEARAIAVRALLAAELPADAASLLDLVPEPEPRDRYLRATVLRMQGDRDEALEELDSVVERAKSESLSADAAFLRGVVLFELERWEAALSALDLHAETFPDHSEAAAREARRMVAAAYCGRPSHAEHLVKQLPRGENAAAVHRAGDIFYDAGDFAAAALLYSELERIGDESEAAAAVSGLAWSARGEGDMDEAVAQFRRLLCEHPDCELASESAFALGELAAANGDLDEAAAMYAFAQRRPHARVGAAMLAEAIALRRAGRISEAAALLNALEADPREADPAHVLYQQAWCARDLGREHEAVKLFLALYDQHPDSSLWADATLRAANGVSSSNPEQAKKLLQEILDHDADATVAASALFGLSQLAAAGGDWRGVRELCQQLVEAYPAAAIAPRARFWAAEAGYQLNEPTALEEFDALGDELDSATAPLALLRRGQLLARADAFGEARRIVEQLIADHPDYVLRYEADYLLGRCLAALGEFDAARAAFQQVLLSPRGGKTETAAMAQWMIGETYFHQKNYPDAVSAYLRVSILFAYPRWKAAALLQAGKCAELLEQPGRAAEFYREGIAASPEGEYVDELRRRLTGLQTATARGARVDETIQQ